MKKLLLATTFLAGSAGLAAAEIKLEGSAEIGIFSNTNDDVQFWQEIEVKFIGAGTTDGGLEFGFKVDLDEAALTKSDGTDDDGTTVYVKGAFGSLTMGDTDGALDWAIQDSGSLTSLADDHTTHIAYFSANGLDEVPVLGRAAGQDGQIVRYDNTFGAFGFAVSLEQVGDGVDAFTASTTGGATTVANGETIWGIGLKYTADLGGTAVNFGLGHQQSTGGLVYAVDGVGFINSGDNTTATAVSVGAELAGGFAGTIGYTMFDFGAGIELDHLGVGLTYTSGPLGVHVNYGQGELSTAAATFLGLADDTIDSYGVAVNYDLGGGAAVQFGYASDMDIAAGDQDQWSLGVGMSF